LLAKNFTILTHQTYYVIIFNVLIKKYLKASFSLNAFNDYLL